MTRWRHPVIAFSSWSSAQTRSSRLSSTRKPTGRLPARDRCGAARTYEIFVAGQRRLLIAEMGSRVGFFDSVGRPLAQAAFDIRDLEAELRAQMRRAGRHASGEPAVRAAGLPVVGALIGIKKGLDACRQLEKTLVLRPIAKACRDYMERKIFKFMAKIVGVKTATALFTCSQALPPKTPPLAREVARMVCG